MYGNSEGAKRQDCTLGKVSLVFWLDCIREKFPLRFNVCRSFPGFNVPPSFAICLHGLPSVDLPWYGLG